MFRESASSSIRGERKGQVEGITTWAMWGLPIGAARLRFYLSRSPKPLRTKCDPVSVSGRSCIMKDTLPVIAPWNRLLPYFPLEEELVWYKAHCVALLVSFHSGTTILCAVTAYRTLIEQPVQHPTIDDGRTQPPASRSFPTIADS